MRESAIAIPLFADNPHRQIDERVGDFSFHHSPPSLKIKMNEQELSEDYLSNFNDLERYQNQGYYDSFNDDEFEYPTE